MTTSTTPAEAVCRGNLLPFRPAPLATPAPLRRGGLTKEEAEQLLDWLGANGCPHLEVSLDGELFTVSYSWGEPIGREGRP